MRQQQRAEEKPRRGMIYPGSNNIKGIACRIEAGHRRNSYITDLYPGDLQAIKDSDAELCGQLMNAYYLGLETGYHAAGGGIIKATRKRRRK